VWEISGLAISGLRKQMPTSAIKTGIPGFSQSQIEPRLKLNVFGIGIFPGKKQVLKHGSYPALTKHGSITDRAVLEQLSLNSTSGHACPGVRATAIPTGLRVILCPHTSF
jgi:hypothetical protein